MEPIATSFNEAGAMMPRKRLPLLYAAAAEAIASMRPGR